MRILLVEDDALLGDGAKAGLAQAGFAVDWVKDGVAAQLALETADYAAVVLDLGLPRLSGLELLRRARAAGAKVPVLILTARDAVEDRIKGLDSGADDYLVKPFDLDELAARLRALIRRAGGEAAPRLRVGELELDPAAHRAAFRLLFGASVRNDAEFAAVAEALDIPVVGNGDIKTAEDAYRMWRETGCAGIMIARGSFGNPWIFQQTRALLEGRQPRPAAGAAERFAVALRHAALQLAIQGDDRRTAVEFRKHLGWYVRGLPGSAELRKKLHAVESHSEIAGIFDVYLRDRARYEGGADAPDAARLEAVSA